MELRCVLIAAVLCVLVTSVNSANVLMVLGFCSKSHKMVFWPLAKALAAKGHNVTIESPYAKFATVPGITEINPPKLVEHTKKIIDSGMMQDQEGSPIKFLELINNLVTAVLETSEVFLSSSVTLRQKTKYDIVFMDEAFFDAGLIVAHVHKAVPAYVSTPGFLSPIAFRTGNPTFSHVTPGTSFPCEVPMTFTERLASALYDMLFHYLRYHLLYPKLDEMAERLLDQKIPSTAELEKEVGLNLVNSHFSIASAPMPYLPNIIEVGGMHCEPAKPLSKDLEDFVSGSGEAGFILISFGTALKTDQLTEETRMAFINAFKQLKQRVVWKWDAGYMDGAPSNVKVAKYLPQQDLLGHPKIRLFITHGGLLSQQETVYHGVPIITVPFYGDQLANSQRAELGGYGIRLQCSDISTERVLEDIRRVLNDPKFSSTAREMSRRYRDQPETPVDRAVFWTEYVLRHGGAPHMRSPARHMPLYQYFMLDIAIVVGAVAGTLVLCVRLLLKCACRRVFCRSQAKKKAMGKKKKRT